MATVGNLLINLGLNTANFKNNLDKARRSISIFSKNTEAAFRKVSGTIKNSLFNVKTAILGVAGGATLGLLSKSFIDAASTAEQLRVRLNVMLGSVAEGTRLFNDMSKFAKKVPFEYKDIMASATALAGVMKGGVNEIKEWMPLIGDLAATTGLSIQDTTSQIQRMLSAGAQSAEMFKERGVSAMLGFQSGVSYSVEETRKMLMDAWKSPTSQFRGATDALAGTWAGLMSMLADKWFALRTKIMDSGLFEILKRTIGDVNKALDKFIDGPVTKYANKLQDWIKDLGGVDAVSKVVISNMLLGFSKIIDGIDWMVSGLSKVKSMLISIGAIKEPEGLKRQKEIVREIHEEVDSLEKKYARQINTYKSYEKASDIFGKLADKMFNLNEIVSDMTKTDAELRAGLAQMATEEGKLNEMLGNQESTLSKLSSKLKEAADDYKTMASAAAMAGSEVSKPQTPPAFKLQGYKDSKFGADINKQFLSADEEIANEFRKQTDELNNQYGDRLTNLNNWYIDQMEMVANYETMIGDITQDSVDRRLAINKAYDEKKRQIEVESFEKSLALAQQLTGLFSQVTASMLAVADSGYRSLEQQAQAAEQAGAANSKALRKQANEARKTAEKAFRLNKAAQIANTIVNTASAVMRAYADFGAVGAVIAAAAGAFQLSVIQAQSYNAGGASVPAGPSTPSIAATAPSATTSGNQSSGGGGRQSRAVQNITVALRPGQTSVDLSDLAQLFKIIEDGSENEQIVFRDQDGNRISVKAY